MSQAAADAPRIRADVVGDAHEHLAEKRFWIDAVEFGAAQQAVDCRSSIAACITAGEHIVPAPKALCFSFA